MLAGPVTAPDPVPVPGPDAELVEAVGLAQAALRRFLASRQAPAYLRQGVAPLMAVSVPTLAAMRADKSGRAF